MYNVEFFRSKLGRASLTSIVAMAGMVALTSQVDLAAQNASIAQPAAESAALVELA